MRETEPLSSSWNQTGREMLACGELETSFGCLYSVLCLEFYGILQRNAQCWGEEKKNMSKKDQGNGPQSQLEPKLRPVHKIYALEALGKQEPPLLRAHRYPQWLAQHLAWSRHAVDEGDPGMSPLQASVAPLSAAPNHIWRIQRFEATFSGPDCIEKLEGGDPAAMFFHLRRMCFVWRKGNGEHVLQSYCTSQSISLEWHHYCILLWQVGFFSPCLGFSPFQLDSRRWISFCKSPCFLSIQHNTLEVVGTW